MKHLIFLLCFFPFTLQAEGLDPHLYIEGGLGGCETSGNNIHACDNGFTNEIVLKIQWYDKGNFYIYSDRRHTSRLEKEDFNHEKGPSGAINTWCLICAGYQFF